MNHVSLAAETAPSTTRATRAAVAAAVALTVPQPQEAASVTTSVVVPSPTASGSMIAGAPTTVLPSMTPEQMQQMEQQQRLIQMKAMAHAHAQAQAQAAAAHYSGVGGVGPVVGQNTLTQAQIQVQMQARMQAQMQLQNHAQMQARQHQMLAQQQAQMQAQQQAQMQAQQQAQMQAQQQAQMHAHQQAQMQAQMHAKIQAQNKVKLQAQKQQQRQLQLLEQQHRNATMKTVTTEAVQAVLDENSSLIVEIMELNESSKVSRGAKSVDLAVTLDRKRKQLNQNLVILAKWADESTEAPPPAPVNKEIVANSLPTTSPSAENQEKNFPSSSDKKKEGGVTSPSKEGDKNLAKPPSVVKVQETKANGVTEMSETEKIGSESKSADTPKLEASVDKSTKKIEDVSSVITPAAEKEVEEAVDPSAMQVAP